MSVHWITWTALAAAIGLSAMAQILFKYALMQAPSSATAASNQAALPGVLAMLLLPGVIAGLLTYGVSTVLWLFALKRLELSLAYPFVAVGIVLTTLAGAMLFNETVSPIRILGVGLICLGVTLVGQSAR